MTDDAPAATSPGTAVAVGASDTAFETFLDRLMRAESDGRDDAANSRSTALGPFQFIKSTFLAVMRRHFPADIANLKERDVLALRTNRDHARRAATAFSKDNLAYLEDQGLKPTFGHLRLAFLLGPSGAASVLQAPPSKSVAEILGGKVIVANPFMRDMTAGDLVARATRDIDREYPVRAVASSRADRTAGPPGPSTRAKAAWTKVARSSRSNARPAVRALRIAKLDRKAGGRSVASVRREARRRA